MTDFKQMMTENFGNELSAKQLWALTLFAKNVRLRCRNNTAFNNFMGRTFPHATFRQVNKTRPSRYNPNIIENYMGLEISVKGEAVSADESED